jgi:prepilin-type N-terminal cleavage/methylation domain-containing protein/prepilin-type processing-associated H-X9-DG protein
MNTPSCQSARFPLGRRAFTLTELLTVIAIIGVLAAILIPVVGKVRQTSRQSACASNLRQIGVAILAYTSEHRNWLPGGYEKTGYWNLYGLQRAVSPRGYIEQGKATQDLSAQLYPYLQRSLPGTGNELPRSTIFVCPGNAPAIETFSDPTPVGSYYSGTGVKLNNGTLARVFGKPQGTRAPNLLDVASPAEAIALFDLDAKILSDLGEGAVTGAPASADEVHGSTRNYLYLDGHVKAQPVDFVPPRAP